MFFRTSTILLSVLCALNSSLVSVIATANTSSSLDALLYKDFNVSRGFLYHYYYSPPLSNPSATTYNVTPTNASKLVILFLHGFPSTSNDWYHQVTFFQELGYGLIVPDMLGYGGTDKPLDPEVYKSSGITKDLVDILDEEQVDRVVVVGHDWGSKISGRLANYYPDRFLGFGFLSIGYVSPDFYTVGQQQYDNLTQAVLGYEQYGYWTFFSTNGTDKIIQDHIDSFFDIFFTADSVQVITNFSPEGALQAWLEGNKTTVTADFITPEERTRKIEEWRSEGLTAALNWYKISTSTIERDDDEGIPQSNLVITKPIFLGAALRDYVGVAASSITSVLQVSQNANMTTIREYDSGHWVQMEKKDEVNRDLLAWFESL